jgi:formylglycine-generating enzyme required for sulfatase activity
MNCNNFKIGCAQIEKPSAHDSPRGTWINPRDGSVMRLIPSGVFVMGSSPDQVDAARHMDIYGHEFSLLDEMPQFSASLPDYYLGECAITNDQFAAFLSDFQPAPAELKLLAPSLERIVERPRELYQVEAGFERHPVIHVSWFGAQEYCKWAGLRLPNELEWEKAARGVDGRIYPWGNEWRNDYLRWDMEKSLQYSTTAPVDAYPQGRSPYGLFQMLGNVVEWCADFYQWDIYRQYETGDLRLPLNGEMRVVRGGNYLTHKRTLFRCAHRRGNDPAIVNVHCTGIRCAADVRKPME